MSTVLECGRNAWSASEVAICDLKGLGSQLLWAPDTRYLRLEITVRDLKSRDSSAARWASRIARFPLRERLAQSPRSVVTEGSRLVFC
jgi:hypothetical protein